MDTKNIKLFQNENVKMISIPVEEKVFCYSKVRSNGMSKDFFEVLFYRKEKNGVKHYYTKTYRLPQKAIPARYNQYLEFLKDKFSNVLWN